jgi:hypothetical protein
MLTTRTVVAVTLAGCSSGGEPGQISDSLTNAGYINVTERGDLDQYGGKRVQVEGRFNHVQGKGVMVTSDSGVLFNIPHFDLFRQGDDWFKYIGHRVSVGGVLHTYTKDVPVGVPRSDHRD